MPNRCDALIQTFTELTEPIRIEAVRALRKISEIETTNIISKLPSSSEDQRAGIAWAISRSGNFVLDDLIRTMVDDDARRCAAYILGIQDKESSGSFVLDLGGAYVSGRPVRSLYNY